MAANTAAALKKASAILVPVNARKILAIDTPMTAAKAKNAVRACPVVMRSTLNEKNMTNASGAKIATHLSGVPKIGWYSAGTLATRNATSAVMPRPSAMLR